MSLSPEEVDDFNDWLKSKEEDIIDSYIDYLGDNLKFDDIPDWFINQKYENYCKWKE